MAVLRAPPPAAQRTLALCSVGLNSADSLASLGPFLGPPARRTRANEPGLPSLLGHALLGARGQSLSGSLPACSNCTVGRGLSLWASISPSLQRGAGTSPEKPREADLPRQYCASRSTHSDSHGRNALLMSQVLNSCYSILGPDVLKCYATLCSVLTFTEMPGEEK